MAYNPIKYEPNYDSQWNLMIEEKRATERKRLIRRYIKSKMRELNNELKEVE